MKSPARKEGIRPPLNAALVPAGRRRLRVVLAEKERGRLARLIPSRVMVRRADNAQACIDLAYAGAADVMLVDLDVDEYADSTFLTRVRFISRCAFPIVGVTSAATPPLERLLREGLADIILRPGLTSGLLESRLRHWSVHHRLRARAQQADRQGLEWWRNLIEGLDEIRLRIHRGLDSTDAFLMLVEKGDREPAGVRRQHLDSARKQLAEIRQVAVDLDRAAQIIRRKGIERSKRDNLAGKRVLLPEGWTRTSGSEKTSPEWLDSPSTPGAHGGRARGDSAPLD